MVHSCSQESAQEHGQSDYHRSHMSNAPVAAVRVREQGAVS